MKLHLTNLDELIQKIRNAHAKNYINESIAAYRTGAYRASLITTWIAVCVDIIEKIRELSLSGDLAAKKIENQLDKIQPNDAAAMLSFEREILNFACDELQLISTIEKSHLERLKDDRNVCAHPTFSDDGSQFSPPAELALSYIVQAANYLLVHSPVRGKIIVQRLYDLISEASFPENEEKAYSLLSSENNLGRVKDSVVRNLSIIILKRLFRDNTGLSPSLLNKLSASLSVIYRLYPVIYDEVVSTKLGTMLSEANDTMLKRIFLFLRLRNELWSKVGHAERVRIEGLINSMNHEEISKYQVTMLAEVNSDIRSNLIEKIDKLDSAKQEKIIAAYPADFLKDKSIEVFSKAQSFDSAEYRGNSLLLPISKNFIDSDLQRIFTGSMENTGLYGINQILNAGAIGEFYSRLYTETKSAPLNHKALWVGFWRKLNEKKISYSSLKEQMIEDHYIEPEESKEDDDDFPF
ncbi:hypothetical protein WH50_16280 [Pokkaliibacter plantistimulans]|uniref:Uncharacterized protein n=1 Tax=Pokkaliibacter plantistimulans TaxID=1635171 RepID=A0ABX5LVL2_9GAMM|nr:hypothetical protein [Pokkaliibacter plantistimulans]PXF30257.1 hypothetical protein WH50_16280 [Pokkaliibacter plantistimulans]